MTSAQTINASHRRIGKVVLINGLAGIGVGAALPPFSFLVGLLGISVLTTELLRAETYRDRFVQGFTFGFFMSLTSLHWITIAFFAEAERFGALALPGIVALCIVVGAIFAFCLALFPYRSLSSGLAAAIAIALLWQLSDLLRGEWGAQFPWNPIAVVWTVSDWTIQPIAWIGTRGLGVITVVAFALLGVAYDRPAKRKIYALSALVILASICIVGGWRIFDLPERIDSPTNLRIVQANIAQHHKGDPDARRSWFMEHLELATKQSSFPISMVIWPESSVPYSLDHDPNARDYIARNLDGAVAIVGSDFVDFDSQPPILHNSVYVLDEKSEIRHRYDKVNLVPFGEFLPFRHLLGAIGLEALAVGSIDFVSGHARHTVELDNLPSFSPLICYEAIFPGSATDGSGRAKWLLNITNDGWFGISAGPYQHLAMARMRAVETGLPLVRAANTGISAITDGAGRLVESLPLGTRGILDAPLPSPYSPPLISRYPWLSSIVPVFALFLFVLAEMLARQSHSRFGK